jgi:hypothetical protein
LDELFHGKPRPTMEEIMGLIPKDKQVIVVNTKEAI